MRIQKLQHFKTFYGTKYVFTSNDHCNVHQLFIATSLQLLLPVIQTNFFSVPRFSIRRNKNPQKLNVIFLDQNRRNFTPQKLPVIRYHRRG